MSSQHRDSSTARASFGGEFFFFSFSSSPTNVVFVMEGQCCCALSAAFHAVPLLQKAAAASVYLALLAPLGNYQAGLEPVGCLFGTPGLGAASPYQLS